MNKYKQHCESSVWLQKARISLSLAPHSVLPQIQFPVSFDVSSHQTYFTPLTMLRRQFILPGSTSMTPGRLYFSVLTCPLRPRLQKDDIFKMTLIFSHALLMIKNPSMVLHYLFVCGLQHSHIDTSPSRLDCFGMPSLPSSGGL